MSIKLIAVDIDGTLVNSKKEITPEVFAAIQDAKLLQETRLSVNPCPTKTIWIWNFSVVN